MLEGSTRLTNANLAQKRCCQSELLKPGPNVTKIIQWLHAKPTAINMEGREGQKQVCTPENVKKLLRVYQVCNLPQDCAQSG